MASALTDELITRKTNHLIRITRSKSEEFSFTYDPVVNFRVDIVTGCIVDQKVDAIVSPTDIKLRLHNAIGEVIKERAGFQIEYECENIRMRDEIEYGMVFPTSSYEMADTCSHIIHMVDPTEKYHNEDPKRWKKIVELLFMKALLIANNLKIKSIAIPIFDLTITSADNIKIFYKTLKKYWDQPNLKDNTLKRVIISHFDSNTINKLMINEFKKLLENDGVSILNTSPRNNNSKPKDRKPFLPISSTAESLVKAADLSCDASTILGGAPDIYPFHNKGVQNVQPANSKQKGFLTNDDSVVPICPKVSIRRRNESRNSLQSEHNNYEPRNRESSLQSEHSNFSINSHQVNHHLTYIKAVNKNLIKKFKEGKPEGIFLNPDKVPVIKTKCIDKNVKDLKNSKASNLTNQHEKYDKNTRNVTSPVIRGSRTDVRQELNKESRKLSDKNQVNDMLIDKIDPDTSNKSSKEFYSENKNLSRSGYNNKDNDDDSFMASKLKDWSLESHLEANQAKKELTDSLFTVSQKEVTDSLYTVSRNSTLVSRSNTTIKNPKAPLNLNSTKTTLSSYTRNDDESTITDTLYIPNFTDFKDDSLRSCTKILSPHGNKVFNKKIRPQIPIASSESSGISSFSTIQRNQPPENIPTTTNIKPKSRTAQVLEEILGDPKNCQKKVKPEKDQAKIIEPIKHTESDTKSESETETESESELEPDRNYTTINTTLNDTVVENGCIQALKALNKACFRRFMKK